MAHGHRSLQCSGNFEYRCHASTIIRSAGSCGYRIVMGGNHHGSPWLTTICASDDVVYLTAATVGAADKTAFNSRPIAKAVQFRNQSRPNEGTLVALQRVGKSIADEFS